jgi:hypothetical protein
MNESLKQILKSHNSGKNFPAVDLVKKNPKMAAMISKLQSSPDKTDSKIINSKGNSNIDQNVFAAISEQIKGKRHDNDNMTQLFPDIELGIQILVSSILSPKDMVKTELIYKLKESVFAHTLGSGLHEITKRHIENHYELLRELPVLLREALFSTGSYIKAVLPESILDDIIHQRNISKESLSQISKTGYNDLCINVGILGGYKPDDGISLESKVYGKAVKNSGALLHEHNKSLETFDEFVTITDNIQLLKFKGLKKALTKLSVKHLTNTALENMNYGKVKKINNDVMNSLMFADPHGRTQNLVMVGDSGSSKRKSVGRPLTMKLPSESVIPVYIPGDETKHIGYFVLIDASGYPVSVNNPSNVSLNNNWQQPNQNGSATSLLQKAKNNLQASGCSDPTNDQIAKIYGNIVETNLINRLRNGVYESDFEISNNEEVYRIMLARSLAGKYTTMVYIPEEYVTYFAFKYNPNGTGKSLLDDLKIITSIRSILLFARIMAMTKSSINITHVNMTLDPNDPDPEKTIEQGMHEVLKMRQNYLPLGINSPTDLVDWINKAGFEFSFEGHPGIPQTKFDFESKNIQHQIPSDDLEENLRKQTYMSFGLSPETVDNGFSSEFATTVVSNNILLSKRVSQYQEILSDQLTDYTRKLLSCDESYKADVIEFLKNNKALLQKNNTINENGQTGKASDDKEELDEEKSYMMTLEKYLEYLTIELPKPDETSVDTQVAAYDKYLEALDKTIDSWVSSEILTSDTAGNISNYADSIKKIVRAYYLRQWMSDNNFMPELSDLITKDEDGKPNMDIFEINQSHLDGLMKSSVKFVDKMSAVKRAADKDLEAMGGEASEPSDSGDSGDESAQSSQGGADEFALEPDVGAQEPAEEEPPADDKEEKEDTTEEK